jgi:hypothetical protein
MADMSVNESFRSVVTISPCLYYYSQNEPFFLQFQFEMNKISVRFNLQKFSNEESKEVCFE